MSGASISSRKAVVSLWMGALVWMAVVATNVQAFLGVAPASTTSFTATTGDLLRRTNVLVAPEASALPPSSSQSRTNGLWQVFSQERSEETSSSSPSVESTTETNKAVVKPEILSPFPPAANPEWMNQGPVGEGDFVVSREGGPTDQELANENILKIVLSECTDLEVNTLVWKCLGYRFQQDGTTWTAAECFPNWKEKYPTPPDLIGMQRIYAPEIDKPSLRANQALVRSIPADNKQSLKEHLKPLGWKGYQYAELTPNKTRRAQCANWLIFYREELYGYSLTELQQRRKERKAEEERKRAQGEWQPPVQEVF